MIVFLDKELASRTGNTMTVASINTSPRPEKQANTLPLLYARRYTYVLRATFISVFADRYLGHHYHYRHYSAIDARARRQHARPQVGPLSRNRVATKDPPRRYSVRLVQVGTSAFMINRK